MADIQGFHLVDDSFTAPDGAGDYRTGYTGRDLDAYPLNSLKCARPFSLPRLDIKTIKELIVEKTAKKTWLKDHCDRVGLRIMNQQRSSYCWGHGLVRTMECSRVLAGGAHEPLSPFYLCSRIMNGRDQGGSGVVAAKWAAEHGTCVESMWPAMKFSGTVTPEILNNAMLHQITSMEELEPDDMLAIYSSICQDQALTVGIPVWTHEVTITFLVLEGDTIYPGFDNSWGTSYGTGGRGVLHGAYTRFDECMRVVAVEPAVA
jgi:hypothetical protein